MWEVWGVDSCLAGTTVSWPCQGGNCLQPASPLVACTYLWYACVWAEHMRVLKGGWDQAARLAWRRPGVARWRGRLSWRGSAGGQLTLQRLRNGSSQALQLRLMRPAAVQAPATLKLLLCRRNSTP